MRTDGLSHEGEIPGEADVPGEPEESAIGEEIGPGRETRDETAQREALEAALA